MAFYNKICYWCICKDCAFIKGKCKHRCLNCGYNASKPICENYIDHNDKSALKVKIKRSVLFKMGNR